MIQKKKLLKIGTEGKNKIMSNWTHVAAVIRIDDFRFGDFTEPDWDKIFGKELLYDELYEKWEEADKYPERYLPMGSEGSLHKNVWVNHDKSSATAYTVSIFGDLRDYDDLDEIINWFKEKCGMLNTRQATIVVSNGLSGNKVWSFSFGEEIK